MQKGDIFWTSVTMIGYGDRVVPYYFQSSSGGMVYGIISIGKCACEFSEKDVFKTVEEARATGIDRVFCYERSSMQHIGIVNKIHMAEGLACPTCGFGTVLIELDPEIFKKEIEEDGHTHFCFTNQKSVGRKSHKYQVTLGKGRQEGCSSFITLELKSSGCNCGSPYVDHVPGGSYCWQKLDKSRKYL